jgi:cytochrome b561
MTALSTGSSRLTSTRTMFWSMASLVVLGAIGLTYDSWLKGIPVSWISVRTLFALLLWSFVIARFYWRVKHSWPMPLVDIRELSRTLSRTVYLLLYVVVGINQLLSMRQVICYGAAFEPAEGLQPYLVYGLVALIIIRILALAVIR